MSRSRLNMITLGILLSLFLASMEGTVVATAMPTIVAQLGGLSIYSWVFSVYMLASTTTVPLYGKLSDVYGRKLVYVISMGLFMAGSLLCGQARTMEQLVLFRAVQGLGAGGVLPLAFTIVGELFSLEQRARMQGLFSGVWGVSSIIGPLIGGFLVDRVAWQWVFYINVIPGLLAAGVVWFAWKGSGAESGVGRQVDYPGAVLLTLAILSLLFGLTGTGSAANWLAVAASGGLTAALVRVEKRAANPILPLGLFRDRLFTIAILHGFLAGWAMFGSLNYVPLFVQAVLGTSATEAGISLTPMSLAWTVTSVLGSQLMLRMSYRRLTLFGMGMLSVGAFLMSRISPQTSLISIMIYTGLMGGGMGFSIPAFLIAVQSTVRRRDLGAATSTVQFSRSIGGTVGVSVMGGFLSARLAGLLLQSGLDPAAVSIDTLLDPYASASAALNGPVRDALAMSISNLFLIAFAAAVLGLVVVFFAPGGMLAHLRSPEEKSPLSD